LQHVVDCDFVSALYRAAPTGLLKERDSRGNAYEPAFMRRYSELTPAIPLVLANPGVQILSTRAAIPGPESKIRASAFYREIMQRQGWRHSVALCFWGEPAGHLPVVVLSVLRIEGRPDFGRGDLARLQSIHPFISCAVNHLHEREQAKSMRDGMSIIGRDGNRGVAVLDSRLRLLEANSLARRLAAAWDAVAPFRRGRAGTSAWLLPPDLAKECHALRREWESSLAADPDANTLRRRRKLRHPRKKTLSASIATICRNTSGLSELSFVIEFERQAPRTFKKVRRNQPLLQMLTNAERAVALVLMEGVSNQEIADRLAKSIDAVKFLLHSIYQKTGTSGRTALVARLRA
jgi:DNA-binding CsgD family transcriptional regulator